MKIQIEVPKGEIINGKFEVLDDAGESKIPCDVCDLNCELCGIPHKGDFQQIGFKLGWTVKIDICENITLDFRELFIEGERLIFNDVRPI